jgi:hypothetical protein
LNEPAGICRLTLTKFIGLKRAEPDRKTEAFKFENYKLEEIARAATLDS